MYLDLAHVSHSFRTDSAHLLEKARAAYKHGSVRERTGYQAKIAVDLFMSIECSLKSLPCSRKPVRDAEEVLRSIFRLGHDLEGLIAEVKPKSIKKRATRFLIELNKKGVSLRYDLDLFSLATCELLRKESEKFKIDSDYVEKLMGYAKDVYAEAQSAHKKKFPKQLKLLTQKDVDEDVANLRKLLADARKKKPKTSTT